ncbi:MAG: hypothetical protein M1832_002025 [Thelocarpon impressellum]|nr:MAG: hypothetical protein M1832_002025 [Thelocarpon impressellum]
MMLRILALPLTVLSVAAALTLPSEPETTAPAELPAVVARDVKGSNVNHAIAPSNAGQIGINQVTSDIGGSQYIGSIGTDTGLLTMESSTIKYVTDIFQHSKWLTVETITTTSNNVPTTTVKTVVAQLATITSPEGSAKSGDVSIIFPPAFHDGMGNAIDAAMEACNLAAPGKVRKRDALSCLADAARNVAADDATWALLDSNTLNAVPARLAANAPAELVTLWAAAATALEKKKLAITWALIGGIAVEIIAGIKKDHDIPVKIVVPALGVGAPVDASPTSSATCKDREANENSYLCRDSRCKGDSSNHCTVGDEKECACVLESFDPIIEDSFTKPYFDLQQEYLSAAYADLTTPESTPTPTTTSTAPTGTCTTSTQLMHFNNNANKIRMGFSVTGTYSGAPAKDKNYYWVYDESDPNVNPKMSTAPGPLPAYLDQTYSVDPNQVRYNYGGQSWTSGDGNCQDSTWDNNLPRIASFPQRQITCTFSC